MMNKLINIICIIILIKYAVVFVGYLGCFIVSTILKFKDKRDNEINGDNIVRSSMYIFIKSNITNSVNGWIRYSLMFTGKIPIHFVRNTIYRYIYNMNIENNVVIYGGSEIRAPHNIKIGRGSIIGDDSKLDGRHGIIIGGNVNLSTGVWIWTEQHDAQCPQFSCKNKGGKVIVEDRVWISCRVTILPGVTIGKGAVIAAGSVVTKDIEPFSIYAGIPAKKIGNRNTELNYEFDGSHLGFY